MSCRERLAGKGAPSATYEVCTSADLAEWSLLAEVSSEGGTYEYALPTLESQWQRYYVSLAL